MMGKGRAPCCDKTKVKKGPWTPAEDLRLIAFIQKNGHENWRSLPKLAGLARCGKSCRLRWINYLRPDVKRGNFTPEEEDTVIRLHESMGNKWSRIASYFPGRTDNEIKNIWNTHLKKRVREGDDVGYKDFSDITSSSSSLSEQNKTIIAVPVEDTSEDDNVVVTIPKSCVYENHKTSSSSSSEEVNKPLGLGDTGTNCLLHDIPNVEVDLEFWSMLDMDNLASYFQTGDDIKVVDEHHQNSSFFGDCSKEAEQNKWLEHLETELGLVELPKEQEDDFAGIFAYSEIWP